MPFDGNRACTRSAFESTRFLFCSTPSSDVITLRMFVPSFEVLAWRRVSRLSGTAEDAADADRRILLVTMCLSLYTIYSSLGAAFGVHCVIPSNPRSSAMLPSALSSTASTTPKRNVSLSSRSVRRSFFASLSFLRSSHSLARSLSLSLSSVGPYVRSRFTTTS